MDITEGFRTKLGCSVGFIDLTEGSSTMLGSIVGRGSELRGPPNLSAKKGVPPTLSKILLLSRKSTKIGKKLTKSRKIAKSSLKHFKTRLF
jgi:hypothetical protein